MPEDRPVVVALENAEQLIRDGQGRAAVEPLVEAARRLLERGFELPASAGEDNKGPRQAGGDPAASRASLVLGESALGASGAAATRRLLGKLAPEERAGWREQLESDIKALWTRISASGDRAARARLRHRLLRDHPDSTLADSLLLEEQNESLEAGDLERTLSCALRWSAQDHPGSARPRTRVVALRHGWLAAQLLHDGAAAKTLEAAIEAVATAPGLDAETREALVRLRPLPEPPGSPFASPAGSPFASPLSGLWNGGSYERNAAEEPDASRPAAPGNDFELGTVTGRFLLPKQDLRAWSEEITAPGPLAGKPTARDVPLPFYPVAQGSTLFVHAFDRVVALELPSLAPRWTHELAATPDELINAVRAPALTSRAVLAVEGDQIVALDRETGVLLWQRHAALDPGTRSVVLLTPEAFEARQQRAEGDNAAPAEKDSEEKKVEAPRDPVDEESGNEKEKGGDEEDGKDAGDGKKAPGRDSPAERKKKNDRENGSGAPLVTLSSPTVLGPSLFLCATVRIQEESQHFTLALDEEGALLWQTSLGSYRPTDHLALAASVLPPLPHKGRLFVLTALGTVAALDSVDGACLWLFRYPRLTAAGRVESIRARSRWFPSPLVAAPDSTAGDTILAAPQDSGSLLALDASNGAVRWQIPREDNAVLVGVDGDLAVLLGGSVRAVWVRGEAAGQTAWSWNNPRPEVVLGRPFLSEGRAFLSLHRELVQLDARSGRLLSSSLWDFHGGGGNLLLSAAPPDAAPPDLPAANRTDRSVARHLIGAGPGEILVYDDLAHAKQAAEERDEPERTLSWIKLLLKAGDLPKAMELLEGWSRQSPAAPSANSTLDRLQFELSELLGHWIETAEQEEGRASANPPARPHLAALHRFRAQLESVPERKLRALIRAGRHSRLAGELDAALRSLEEGLLFLETAPPSAPGPLLYRVDASLAIPAVDALRDAVAEIRALSPEGRSAFQRFERNGEARLEEARQAGTQAAFRRVVAVCPFTRAALTARRELASFLLNQQNPPEAIRTLQELLRDHADANEFAQIKLELADLFFESQRFEEGRQTLLELQRERPNDTVREVPAPTATPRKDSEGAEPRPPSASPTKAKSKAKSGEPPLLPVNEAVRQRLVELEPLLGAAGDRRVLDLASERPPLRFPLRKAWRSPANLAASSRVFLYPEGPRPDHLSGVFFTRSREVVECRRIADGYPLWTVELSLVPGFQDSAIGAGFLFRALPNLTARFCGETLLVSDTRSILAADTRTGRLTWQRTFGKEIEEAEENAEPDDAPARPPGRGRIARLPEEVRGVASATEGVFIATSYNAILGLSIDGAERWRRVLEADPKPAGDPASDKARGRATGSFVHSLFVYRGSVIVVEESPLSLARLDALSGEPGAAIEIKKGPEAGLVQRPTLLGSHLLLPLPDRLEIVDLERGAVSTPHRLPGYRLQKLWAFPDLPKQAFVLLRGQGDQILVGVEVETGRELWRHPGLSIRSGDIVVTLDANRFFLLQGQANSDRRTLQSFEFKTDPATQKSYIAPAWPAEVEVGSSFVRESERALLLTQDAVLVPDPGSSSLIVFDRFSGSNRSPLARTVTSFLRDKRSRLACDVVDGVLVLLTEEGDAGYEGEPRPGSGGDPMLDARLVKRHEEKPEDWDNVATLAARLFVQSKTEPAIHILDKALLSEGLPSLESPGKYQLLQFMLNGMKEEAEALKDREERVAIRARKFRSPPSIDGDLSDPWSYTRRIEMRTMRSIGLIPAPGQSPDVWSGEEDLSATLYTGWDDRYFYFALDVDDSQIYPFNKDADVWRGDCLVIGVDPTGDGGYFQHRDDQLMTLALTVPRRKAPGEDEDGENGDDEDEEEEERNKPRGLFSVKKKDDNSGVVYEVGLPWASFGGEDAPGVDPMRGLEFGLSLLITDDDTNGGATKTLSLTPCHLLPRDPKRIWRFLTPEYFPRVILE